MIDFVMEVIAKSLTELDGKIEFVNLVGSGVIFIINHVELWCWTVERGILWGLRGGLALGTTLCIAIMVVVCDSNMPLFHDINHCQYRCSHAHTLARFNIKITEINKNKVHSANRDANSYSRGRIYTWNVRDCSSKCDFSVKSLGMRACVF